MSNRRRTYTNAPNVTVNNPLSPTPAPSRPSSGASATTPRAAAPAPSAGAATGPPAAVAAVPLLCTPALLSCHSALLKATSGLSTALADWRAQFAVAARIIASLANVAPRWQTLAKEENERIAREERREANRKQPPAPLPLLVEEEGAFFFCEPLASDGAPGDEESARPPAVLGVLAAIPGLVSKLALQHERQIEIAWKLLVQTQSVRTPTRDPHTRLESISLGKTQVHRGRDCCWLGLACGGSLKMYLCFLFSSEFPSSYQCLSGIFDAVHDAYDLNKRVLTPAQLTAWCSTAPGASSSATSGSAHKKVASSAQKSGKKGSSSSSAAASVSGASSTSNGGSGKEEGGGNSVWNIMHHAEEIERMVQEESVGQAEQRVHLLFVRLRR